MYLAQMSIYGLTKRPNSYESRGEECPCWALTGGCFPVIRTGRARGTWSENLQLLGVWVERLARTVAVLGGLVLVAVALVTVISITGRAFLFVGLKPIPGDFELVEAGTVFVVCAFLPWCQLQRGHATVTIFTDFLPGSVNRVLDVIADALLLAAAVVMTWRHIYGLLDKLAYNETTFILRFPIWWSYSAAMLGLVTWIIVAAYCTANSTIALVAPDKAQPRETEMVH